MNSFEVYLDWDRLLSLRFLVLFLVVLLSVLARLLLSLGLVFVGILAFVFVLIVRLLLVLVFVLLLPYFIAARSERILGILGKSHEIHTLQVAIHIVKIRLIEDRLEVAARSHHQVFAVIAEGRVISGIPVVGHRR